MERVGEEHIFEKDGQVSCNGGRRDKSKPESTGALEEGGDRVGESRDGVDGVGEIREGVNRKTKVEADGEGA